jgi:hypothetical protein
MSRDTTGVEQSTLLDRLGSVVAELQQVDMDEIEPAEQLRFVRDLEVVRRKLDHGTDRATGLVDAAAAFGVDGHRNVRDAVKHLGRLSGADALGRTQTVRALRLLPVVAEAYAAGRIPTAHMRLIARVAANPRVHQHLGVADPMFARLASRDPYGAFAAWMHQWTALADADGADRDDEITHRRRRLSLQQNFDGSWSLEGRFGTMQGAGLRETLERFEDAEFRADWAQARERHGDAATVEHLARTAPQRRADALAAMASWAAAAPPDSRTPDPLVNIVVDRQTFEEEMRRACGEGIEHDPEDDLAGRWCHTIAGAPLHPSDVIAAAMVGSVRRVVVDAAGNVTDLGRRRRLFTGSSREAAMLQAMMRSPGGLRCFWPGCDGRDGCLQVDHCEPAAAGGRTDVANSDVYCGFHNRTKERGFKPVRNPDGAWTMHRPHQGGPITSAA